MIPRYTCLNALSYTHYPILTQDGSKVPWFDLQEFEKLLVGDSGLTWSGVLHHISKSLSEIGDTSKTWGFTVFIELKHKDNEMLKRLAKSFNNSNVLNIVFTETDIDTRSAVHVPKLIKSDTKSYAQVNDLNVITPFKVGAPGLVRFASRDDALIPTSSFEYSCDYEAIPELYIVTDDNTPEQVNLFTIRRENEHLPVTVMSRNLKSVMEFMALHNCKLVHINVPDSLETDVLSGYFSNENIAGFIIQKSWDTVYNRLDDTSRIDLHALRKHGYQYIRMTDGQIFGFSTIFGIESQPVKYLQV